MLEKDPSGAELAELGERVLGERKNQSAPDGPFEDGCSCCSHLRFLNYPCLTCLIWRVGQNSNNHSTKVEQHFAKANFYARSRTLTKRSKFYQLTYLEDYFCMKSGALSFCLHPSQRRSTRTLPFPSKVCPSPIDT